MGLYINKGNAGFASVCGSGFVDKSMLIDKVNRVLQTESRFMCVTRARRFGKSVAVKMLNAYYDKSCDSSKLFENLQINKTEDYKKHLNRYPVIYLDMTDFLTKYGNVVNLVEKIKQDITNELLSLYCNDMHRIGSKDDVLTLLCHLGYLSYNWESGKARIPNHEVRNEFEMAIADTHWTEVQKALRQSDHLLDCVLSGDAEAVAQCVELVHQDNTSILTYNNENALACVLTLALYTARKMYQMVRELPSGKGFADIVLLPYRGVDAPAIVLELKYNGTAESAISQIKRQDYAGALDSFSGEVVLVGINYHKKNKLHSCQIERMKVPSVLSNTKGNTKSNTNEEGTVILTEQQQKVLEYCKDQPHTALEIFHHLSITKQAKHYKLYVDALLQTGYLLDTTPENKRDKRYLSVEN